MDQPDQPRSAGCLTEAQLESLVSGAISESERPQLEAHAATCPDCGERHRRRMEETLARSMPTASHSAVAGPSAPLPSLPSTTEPPPSAPLASPPPPRAPVAPARRPARPAPAVRLLTVSQKAAGVPRWKVLLAIAGLSALVLLFTRARERPPVPTETESEALLRFLVLHDGLSRRGAATEKVSASDQLRFGVDPAHLDGRSLGILGKDPKHKVTVYFPGNRPGVRTVVPTLDDEGFLSTVVHLDGNPGRETLFALICSEVVSLAPLVAALEAGQSVTAARGSIPGDPRGACALETVTLLKGL